MDATASGAPGALAPAATARGRALRAAGLLLVAAFAAVALVRVDLGEVLLALRRARPLPLLLAMAANVLSQWLHAGRWAAVVRPPGVAVRARDAFAPLVAGYAVGLAVPARAGDLVRAHLLARRTGLATAAVLAAALLDYLVGIATLVPLAGVLAVATPLPAWARDVLLAFAAVTVAGLVVVRLVPPPRAGAAPRRGLRRVLASLRAGLGAAHQPTALGRALAWGLLGWVAELGVALFSLAAMDLPPTLELAGLLVVATTGANVLSLSPGNAGPFEVAAALVLRGLGIAAAPALAFALLYHAAHLVPMAAVGGVVLLREARRGRERPGLPGSGAGPAARA